MEAARRRACLIAGLALVAGCGGSHNDTPPASRANAAAAPCTVDRGVLPKWARAGFSDPEPKMPHVLGSGGHIAAVIFGDPLYSPPDAKRANKVLWVPHETPLTYTRLAITATNGDRTVHRKVDLGPSYVDLPTPGCWQLSLSWKGHKDTLALRYVAPR